ncbi:hypothetical protein HPB49_019958 [Dermacentor silvarum]|uniref:Uncharacterized protein n=1 Tax=Dermacentor silvarum TaxID=543639 RepID=A0ACB8DKR1_DERSI|nr:hypothetical protein HPB49_019958 [Dermacentor silvarum]
MMSSQHSWPQNVLQWNCRGLPGKILVSFYARAHWLLYPNKTGMDSLALFEFSTQGVLYWSQACHGLWKGVHLMANHQQQPAHDFAPSWLKIPTYDTAKNSDASHHNARSDEHRLGFHRRSGGSLRSGFHSDGYRERDPGGRQSPLGDGRGLPFSARHASADAEDRLFHHSVPSSGAHKATQPPRRPHSRHDFRDFLQPAYHKMSPSAVQSSDNCANATGTQVGSAAVSQRSKKDLPGNNFNQEFPTLLGAAEAPVQQPPVVNGSVWENPRNSKVHGTVLKKVHLAQRPSTRTEAASLLEVRSKSPNSTSGASPSVVSAAGALSPKLGRPASLTAPLPAIKSVSASQNSLYKALLPSNKKGQLVHAMEILVKHPKTKGNKGDFLKALRSADGKDDETATAKDAGGDTMDLHDRTNGHAEVQASFFRFDIISSKLSACRCAKRSCLSMWLTLCHGSLAPSLVISFG